MKISKTILTLSLSLTFAFLVSCNKEDNENPVITVNGDENTSVGINTVYVELGATAVDNVDGALVPIVDGTVNTNVANTYTLSYTVTDKSGNSATAYRYVSVKNLVLYLEGKFQSRKLAFDSLGVQYEDTTYSQTVSASTTINNRIQLLKFGNITFAPTSTKINADVNSNGTSLVIPMQSALAKANNQIKTHYYRGNGTVSGDSLIEITYFDSLPHRTPERCTLKMTK